MGAFYVRWQEVTAGAYTEFTLFPGPTGVEYPPRRIVNTRTGPDGNVVVQRPMRDDRMRKWVWNRYRDNVPGYHTMWPILEALEYRTRLEANKPPHVEIWEDVTLAGGFGKLTGGVTRVWTKVKFLQVHRTMASGAGSIYEESYIEFIIDDVTYTGF